jgi:hypothetical protein
MHEPLVAVSHGWVPTLDFAARLAAVRHELNWNIAQAANNCDIAVTTWRGWELERRSPRNRVTVIRKIHLRTGVDPVWLQGSGTTEVDARPGATAASTDEGPVAVGV